MVRRRLALLVLAASLAARRTHLTQPILDPSAYPPSGQAFLARFRERNGRDADPVAIFGYEAMAVILDAIDRASDPARRDAFSDATVGTYGGYRIDRGRIAWDRVLDIAR